MENFAWINELSEINYLKMLGANFPSSHIILSDEEGRNFGNREAPAVLGIRPEGLNGIVLPHQVCVRTVV